MNIGGEHKRDPQTAIDLDAVGKLPAHCWQTLLRPDTWLGHVTPQEFLGVSGVDVFSVASESDVKACFAERGVEPGSMDLIVGRLLDADVSCVSHALSTLLSISPADAKRLMPLPICEVIGGHEVSFDHIGVEVFGKLEWYIELFERAYAPLGINVVRERIFPSVQVRRALEYDKGLGDVRIGRVFFAHGDNEVNLEVFEATQSWKYIATRQACLYAHLTEPQGRSAVFSRLLSSAGTSLEPVGHVAYRVPCSDIVESIQAVLLSQPSSASPPTMRPYVKQVFFNPADSSTNTKFVVSTALPGGHSIDSQIIEIICYDTA